MLEDKPDHRLASIAAAAEAFSDAIPDVEALLGIIAEHISRATGDFCSVVLLSPDGRFIEPVAAYHPNPELTQYASHLVGKPMDIESAGPWKTVLGEKRTLVIPIDPDHLPSNLAPHQRSHVQRWRMRESAMIPMLTQDKVVGGLNLNRYEGSIPFSQADLDLLDSLASRAARAIATAQLLRNQRLLASELEAKVEARTQALHLAQQEAEQANAAKGRFLANVSHELRTPLNSIISFARILQQDSSLDPDTRTRFLAHITDASSHLLDLINDILDLTKAESGHIDLSLAPVPLAPAVSQVLGALEPQAKAKAISLSTSVPEGLTPSADPHKLRQMLTNLVANAIKFTPNGGAVSVGARKVDSMVEIAVTDTGIGISETDLSLLFQEFTQLDSASSQQGTGLGLALTKRFANLHGGTVTVQSVLGVGSTFTLLLPAAAHSPALVP